MQCKPHGTCVILNNFNFNYNEDKRYGSEEDVTMLNITFMYLGYEVVLYEDKTAYEIKNIFENISKDRKNYSADSCVVVIMSHGSEGIIYGTCGGEVILEEIYEHFNNETCDIMRHGKPKIFFIQACRGGYKSYRNPVYGSWFVQHLTHVLLTRAHNTDLLCMLYEVSFLFYLNLIGN
ncbi:caspase-2-like [Centruroides sculpturatus]|uniref:caspase-2-like n=1 Tax=Centruroides sculpturatus TaxID=218467 RepID=UPI000C6CA5D1|nr:caspase-2-like [Centruroides sculpturatus]